jgi:hypothetical protein
MTAAVRVPRASRAARFTQRDITRAIKAAVAAGMKVVGTRIEPDGAFKLIYAGASDDLRTAGGSALDRWLEEKRAR